MLQGREGDAFLHGRNSKGVPHRVRGHWPGDFGSIGSVLANDIMT
jgi:hypothetical protein